MNPRYPIYVISKGRWATRWTSDALERMGVPYLIVVEPQEEARYADYVAKNKILVTPFSNLGLGSIPVRNFIWEHSTALGAKRHWCIDDNIHGFYRLHMNLKIMCSTGAVFAAAEDFTDRYENVPISGFQYFMFARRKEKAPAFALNTRVYSCILIQNDLRLGEDGVGQWRGRYNEDTDLSIRALKAGFCTILFYAFLCEKQTTMTMKGGNTDELYAGTNEGAKENDGRWKMAESLRLQHPELVQITRKWGRWQHHVDYRPFKRNKLIRRADAIFPEGSNNYGMILKEFAPEEPRIEAPIYRAPEIVLPEPQKEDRTSIEYFARMQDELRERGRLSALAWHKERNLRCSL